MCRECSRLSAIRRWPASASAMGERSRLGWASSWVQARRKGGCDDSEERAQSAESRWESSSQMFAPWCVGVVLDYEGAFQTRFAAPQKAPAGGDGSRGVGDECTWHHGRQSTSCPSSLLLCVMIPGRLSPPDPLNLPVFSAFKTRGWGTHIRIRDHSPFGCVWTTDSYCVHARGIAPPLGRSACTSSVKSRCRPFFSAHTRAADRSDFHRRHRNSCMNEHGLG